MGYYLPISDLKGKAEVAISNCEAREITLAEASKSIGQLPRGQAPWLVTVERLDKADYFHSLRNRFSQLG